MAAFYSGDSLNAIVGDIGQYATKIGFAGEDYPRSYFRSNVAVIREQDDEEGDDDENGNGGGGGGSSMNSNNNDDDDKNKKDCTSDAQQQQQQQQQRRKKIQKIHYDFFSRPIISNNNTDVTKWHDGKYQTSNPIDSTTGLLYDDPTTFKTNLNDNASSTTQQQQQQDTSTTTTNTNTQNYYYNDGADWYDQLQLMIQHGYESAGLTNPENHPFLLAERSYNPPPIRQQIIECLFEGLQMPAVFLARDATLACYAVGRTTGTVVDIGYGGTTVTPVFDGYVEQKAIRRSPVGTLAIDERILQTLDYLTPKNKPFMPIYQVRRKPTYTKRADSFHKLARLQIAQQCREEGVGAAIDTTATAVAFAARNIPFKLPDGQAVQIPTAHRFATANLLIGTDEESCQYREDLVASRTKKLSSFITATTASTNENNNNNDDDNENNKKDNNNNNNNKGDSELLSSSQYTEATAVGISSPSTRRGRPRRSSGGISSSAAAAAAATDSRRLSKQQQQQSKNGGNFSFSNRILQRACSSYLQSHLDHITSAPLANMVCDAAFRCDRDQQPQLLGNVVLAGGGACLGPTPEAVPDYLRTSVETIIHTHTPAWRVKVLTPGGNSERAVCSWLGGSILGSLGTFHEMWITKAEYEEYGTCIVNRKCP